MGKQTKTKRKNKATIKRDSKYLREADFALLNEVIRRSEIRMNELKQQTMIQKPSKLRIFFLNIFGFVVGLFFVTNAATGLFIIYKNTVPLLLFLFGLFLFTIPMVGLVLIIKGVWTRWE